MNILKRNQRGDTILEVLLVIAVLSLVLTISMALSNRSSQGNRQAQERGEASKMAESQIEYLKSYITSTTNPALPASGSKFCMKTNGTPTATIAGNIPSDAQQETFSAFNDAALAECKKGEFYHSYIERQGNTFTAHTRWTKVNGNGIDEATMVHRVYPDLVSVDIGAGSGTTGCPPNYFMNALGGCVVCPNGYTSPGGMTNSCAPVMPKAIISVLKIRPNDGSTPDCSSINTETKSGINVGLARPGESLSSTTDSLSKALFNDLQLNTTYTATVTAPNGYQVCSPTGGAPESTASQPVTTGGYGPSPGVGTETTRQFKIIPICKVEDVYEEVDNGSNHEHTERQIVETWAVALPEWGPSGPPSTNPRYPIGDDKNGYPDSVQEGEFSEQNPERYVYIRKKDLEKPDKGVVGYYAKWHEKARYDDVVVLNHWHEKIETVKTGTRKVCPN